MIRVAPVLLAAAALLTGCGGGGLPEGPRVDKDRAAAVADVGGMTAQVLGGLPRHGESTQDSCASGQRNLTVRDGFRFRCGAGMAVLAGLPGPLSTTLTTLAGRLTAACPGWPSGLDQPGPERTGLDEGRAGAILLVAGSCDQALLEVRVLRATDRTLAPGLSFLPATPDGTRLSGGPLEVEAALAAATRAGHERVVLVSIVQPYAEVAR